MQEKGFKQLSFLFNNEGLFGSSEWKISFKETPSIQASRLNQLQAQPQKPLEKYKKILEEALRANQKFSDCCIELIICIQQDAKARLDKQDDISHFIRLISHLILIYSAQDLPEEETIWVNCLSTCKKNIPETNFLEAFLTIRFALLGTDEKRQLYIEKHNIDNEKFELTNQGLIQLLADLLGNELYQNKAQLISFINALLPDAQNMSSKNIFFLLLQSSIEKAQLSEEDCNQFPDTAKTLLFKERKIKILTEVQNLRTKINDITVQKTDLFIDIGEAQITAQKEILLRKVDTLFEKQNSEWPITDYSQGCKVIENLTKELGNFSNEFLALIAEKKKYEINFQQAGKETHQAHTKWYDSQIPKIRKTLNNNTHQKHELFHRYYENIIKYYPDIQQSNYSKLYQQSCDLAIQSDAEKKEKLTASIVRLKQIIKHTNLESLQEQKEIITDIKDTLKSLQSFDSLTKNLQPIIEQIEGQIKKAPEYIPEYLLEDFYSAIELHRCLQTPSPLVAIAGSTIFNPEEKVALFEQFTQANFYRESLISEQEDFIRKVVEDGDIKVAKLLLNPHKKQIIKGPVNANILEDLRNLSREFDNRHKENQDVFQKLNNQCDDYFSKTKNAWSRQKRLYNIERSRFLELEEDFNSVFSIDEWKNIKEQFAEIQSLLNQRQDEKIAKKRELSAYQKDFSKKRRLAEKRKVIVDYSKWFETISQSNNKEIEIKIDQILKTLQSTFAQATRKIYDKVQEEYNRTDKIKNNLLEDASQIDEIVHDQFNAINQLLYPNNSEENLIQSVDDVTKVFSEVGTKLGDLRQQLDIAPSNNESYLNILKSIDGLLKQKEAECNHQEKSFLFWFIGWLGDWVNWSIFSWALDYKAKYDTSEQVVKELTSLKNQCETLNNADVTIEAELNILQEVENSFDQKDYINLLTGEDLTTLETYLGKRSRLLGDTQELADEITRLEALRNQLQSHQENLSKFLQTKSELSKKAETESKKLEEYEKILNNLDQKIKTTATEKYTEYHIRHYKESNYPSPFFSVLLDKTLTNSEKKACVDELMQIMPGQLLEPDEKFNSVLHIAVETNQPDIAREVISKHPTLLTWTNSHGETPVLRAFKLMRLDLIELFVKQKAQLPIDQLKGYFLDAIAEGNVETVKLFLNYRIQLLNLSSLHIRQALIFKRKEIFELLIQYIEFDQKDRDFNSLLMLAIWNDAQFAIDKLLELMPQCVNFLDLNGNNALKIAVLKKQSETVRKLVRAGAKELHSPLLSLRKELLTDEVVLWLLVANVQLARLDYFLYPNDLSKFLYLASVNPDMKPEEKQKVVSYLTTQNLIQFKPVYCDAQKNHALHYFAQTGHIGAIKDLVFYLKERKHVNVSNSQGDTALHVAIRGNTTAHQEIAVLLIERGADFNAMNLNHESPLFLAAHSNNISMFDAVFKTAKGNDAFNINVYPEQQHTLLFSVYTNKSLSPGFYTHVLNTLLDNHAVFREKDYDADGNNLLHHLVKNGNFLLCEKIVNKMKKMPEAFNRKNKDGNTALHLAAMGKTEDHRKIAKLLLEHSANPIVYNDDGLLPLHVSCSENTVKVLVNHYPQKLNMPAQSGETLENLILDKNKRSYEENKILALICNEKPIEEKKQIQASSIFNDISGIEKQFVLPPKKTADESLGVSISEKEKSLFEKIATLKQEEYNLLVDPDINLNCVDENGMTPLGHAVLKGDENLINFLLDFGVDLNQKISIEGFPIFLAIRVGNTKIVECLIRHGAKIDTEINGYTLLHFAAKTDKKGEILSHLIPKFNANQVSTQGEMPLHTAVKAGNLEAVKILVENNANVTATNVEGKSPLHLAIAHKKIKIFNYLVECSDIDMNQPDLVGNTPLHFALQCETSEYFDALFRKNSEMVSKNNAAGESPLIASVNGQNYAWVGEKSLAIPRQEISYSDQCDLSLITQNLRKSSLMNFSTMFLKYNLVYVTQYEYRKAKKIIEKNTAQENRLAALKERLFSAIKQQNFSDLTELFSQLDQEEAYIEARLSKEANNPFGNGEVFELREEFENHKNLMTALANSTDDEGNTALHYLPGFLFNLIANISKLLNPHENSYQNIIKWLLDHGASLNAKNFKGDLILISELERLYFGGAATEMPYEDAGILEVVKDVAKTAISFGKESLDLLKDTEENIISELKDKPITVKNYELFNCAIRNKKIKLTQFLIEKIATSEIAELLTKKNEFGDTLLHSALRYSPEKIILILLNKMSQAEIVDASLRSACRDKPQAILLTMLDNVNKAKALDALHECNRAGQTPLHLAARRKTDGRGIFSKLLGLGADLDQRTLIFERAPLDIAKETGIQVQDIVINAKKKRNERIKSYTLIYQIGTYKSPIISEASAANPVLLFCTVGHEFLVSYRDGTPNQKQYSIPESMENIENINKVMKNQLSITITKKCQFPIVRSLWEWVRNYNLPESRWKLYEEMKPKQNQILQQAKEIEFNANINQSDENGDTLLHLVAKNNDINLMMLLLENWYMEHELNAKNNYGDSPLHIAARLNNTRMLALLLHYGADLNQKDSLGFSALDLAVQNRDLQMIALLLSYCGSQDKFAQVIFNAKQIVNLSGDSSLQSLFDQEVPTIEFEEYVDLIKQYCQVTTQPKNHNTSSNFFQLPSIPTAPNHQSPPLKTVTLPLQ